MSVNYKVSFSIDHINAHIQTQNHY